MEGRQIEYGKRSRLAAVAATARLTTGREVADFLLPRIAAMFGVFGCCPSYSVRPFSFSHFLFFPCPPLLPFRLHRLPVFFFCRSDNNAVLRNGVVPLVVRFRYLISSLTCLGRLSYPRCGVRVKVRQASVGRASWDVATYGPTRVWISRAEH